MDVAAHDFGTGRVKHLRSPTIYYSPADWERIAVNHYRDEKMEAARVKLVRYALGYAAPPEESHLSLKELLVAVAAELKA